MTMFMLMMAMLTAIMFVLSAAFMVVMVMVTAVMVMFMAMVMMVNSMMCTVMIATAAFIFDQPGNVQFYHFLSISGATSDYLYPIIIKVVNCSITNPGGQHYSDSIRGKH
jgi:hypothetical protein